MLKQHMPKLYTFGETDISKQDLPVYVIRDGKFFRTIHHPNGWSENPDFELKPDGKIYAGIEAANIENNVPYYEFRNDKKIYRADSHPDGPCEKPEYEIRD